jgi:hypothetical protein
MRPTMRARDDKKDKRVVNYGPGHPDAHCAICTHYQGRSCELVRGQIAPRMWCVLFSRKPGAQRVIT